MSSFRIKKIDLGLVDEWIFRENDDGATLGDDIVAEDPNSLAMAMSDTQELLLRASIYAPGDLIDPNSGALERIKYLEDNVGTTSLQDAYDNGNFINVTPGLPLLLGAGGVITVDSLNNVTFNPNTMRVASGALQMNISHTGVTSSTNNMTIGTTSPSRDLSVLGGNNLYLKDGNLIAPLPLSAVGVTTLNTVAQSIVGAINEINSGFTGTSLQQIYNQSSPPRITTTVGGGAVQIQNGTGSPSTAALKVTGIVETTDTAKVNTLAVGPVVSPALTVTAAGLLTTSGNIKTTASLLSNTLQAEIGSLTLADTLGSADLTSILDPALTTTKQTIFGAINEVNTLATANASTLAAFDVQHDTATGFHEIITTQAAVGFNATDRFIIRNSSGVNVVTANALGEMVVQELNIGAYTLSSELADNETHRNGDGTDHSAVAAHLAAANPHNVVKYLHRQGSPQLTGDVTLVEGPGITIIQTGNDIEISAAASSTLQGVYDTQPSGNWTLTAGKNLNLKNDLAQDIVSFQQDSLEVYKNINLHLGANIVSDGTFNVESSGDVTLQSTGSDVFIQAPVAQVHVSGVKFASTVPEVLPPYVPDTLMGALNETINHRYHRVYNNSNETIAKGTAITVTPFPVDINDPVPPEDYVTVAWTTVTTADVLPDYLYYKRVMGVADEDIAPGSVGYIKTSGLITAPIGVMDLAADGTFQFGDLLYVARQGYGQVEITNIGSVANNNTITIDAGGAALVLTAKLSAPGPGEFLIDADPDLNLKTYNTLDNFINALNDEGNQLTHGSGAFKAFHDGKAAEANVYLTGNTTVGDQFTIGALAGFNIAGVTLTAVAIGAKTLKTQFEVGLTPSHAARNLAEALNENTYGIDFTLIKAEAVGDYIKLKAVNKNIAMNSVTLSTTSSDITTPANLSGGRSIARIYTLNRDANGKTITTSNGAAISVTNFTSDENDEVGSVTPSHSQYISDRRIKAFNRSKDPGEHFVKIGKVLATDESNPSEPTVTFLIEIEEDDAIVSQ